MQASFSMPWSRHCMTADPFKGAAWCITATGACKADSSGRRNRICWLTGRHGKPTPHLLTVKHAIGVVAFDGVGSSTLDKHSAVLGLVQDEPTLRAGAASGILDKTCARRSAGGRSAPRNGPLGLTKECNAI